MRALVLLAALAAAPAPARAAAPPWAADPCLGLDCAATLAGVGQADLLPEAAVSSAVAYAQAARALSGALAEAVSVNDRQYEEEAGRVADSAVKDMVRSPLGSALTKVYAAADADSISVTIALKPLADGTSAYAQEFVDVSSGTLWVRVALARDAAAPAPAGFAPWRGRRLRTHTADLRAGGREELTLWVQDADAGTIWVEHWPSGGADLMVDGAVARSYMFDRVKDAWRLAPPKPAVAPPAP